MKNEYLQIRVSPELKEMIRKAAQEENKNISEWVLDIIKFEIKKNQ